MKKDKIYSVIIPKHIKPYPLEHERMAAQIVADYHKKYAEGGASE